jgi:hypothetical protein
VTEELRIETRLRELASREFAKMRGEMARAVEAFKEAQEEANCFLKGLSRCRLLGPAGMEVLRRWDARQPGPPRKADPRRWDDAERLCAGPLGLTYAQWGDMYLPEIELYARMWLERENYDEWKGRSLKNPPRRRRKPKSGVQKNRTFAARIVKHYFATLGDRKPSLAECASLLHGRGGKPLSARQFRRYPEGWRAWKDELGGWKTERLREEGDTGQRRNGRRLRPRQRPEEE